MFIPSFQVAKHLYDTFLSHFQYKMIHSIPLVCQGLIRLCVQRVIWTPRTLFFDSLDTQRFISEFADDDFSWKIEDVEAVVSLL